MSCPGPSQHRSLSMESPQSFSSVWRYQGQASSPQTLQPGAAATPKPRAGFLGASPGPEALALTRARASLAQRSEVKGTRSPTPVAMSCAAHSLAPGAFQMWRIRTLETNQSRARARGSTHAFPCALSSSLPWALGCSPGHPGRAQTVGRRLLGLAKGACARQLAERNVSSSVPWSKTETALRPPALSGS